VGFARISQPLPYEPLQAGIYSVKIIGRGKESEGILPVDPDELRITEILTDLVSYLLLPYPFIYAVSDKPLKDFSLITSNHVFKAFFDSIGVPFVEEMIGIMKSGDLENYQLFLQRIAAYATTGVSRQFQAAICREFQLERLLDPTRVYDGVLGQVR
jgi:hypothetical protein